MNQGRKGTSTIRSLAVGRRKNRSGSSTIKHLSMMSTSPLKPELENLEHWPRPKMTEQRTPVNATVSVCLRHHSAAFSGNFNGHLYFPVAISLELSKKEIAITQDIFPYPIATGFPARPKTFIIEDPDEKARASKDQYHGEIVPDYVRKVHECLVRGPGLQLNERNEQRPVSTRCGTMTNQPKCKIINRFLPSIPSCNYVRLCRNEHVEMDQLLHATGKGQRRECQRGHEDCSYPPEDA
ncbi:hypothetical protein TELCIR_06803 [Teladorsagia circumcincta]|uniref:Uncharacterized protein n=1 Tax=Teladorsagia circumcincta TaxID=45464 RepID=A0A2G9UM11_TELCI|nr:hypothetical protein TELCIR_06803 [Teladorsagia circumcincta]